MWITFDEWDNIVAEFNWQNKRGMIKYNKNNAFDEGEMWASLP